MPTRTDIRTTPTNIPCDATVFASLFHPQHPVNAAATGRVTPTLGRISPDVLTEGLGRWHDHVPWVSLEDIQDLVPDATGVQAARSEDASFAVVHRQSDAGHQLICIAVVGGTWDAYALQVEGDIRTYKGCIGSFFPCSDVVPRLTGGWSTTNAGRAFAALGGQIPRPEFSVPDVLQDVRL